MGNQINLQAMRYFITDRRFFGRLGEIFIVLVFLSLGLFVYQHFKYHVEFFKPYHLKAYIDYLRSFSLDETSVAPKPQLGAQAVPVLVYHGVLSDKEFEKSDQSVKYVNTSYSKFRDQMLELKNNGWNTITYKEFRDFILNGKSVPEKSFLLTFDDARKDSFYPVDPILKALDFNAVSFVITARSIIEGKSTYYMGSEEIQMAIDSGRWEILSHGKNDHDFIQIDENGNKGAFMSNKLWIKESKRLETEDEFKLRIRTDLESSKNELESKFGLEISGFAFPFGDFGLNTVNYPESEAIIREISGEVYELTFHQASYKDTEVFNYPGRSGVIRRIKGDSSLDGKAFVSLLETLSPKKLPYSSGFEKAENLKKNWGDIELKDSGLILRPAKDSTSAFYTITGSSLWRDYSATLKVEHFFGQSLSLIGYYKNEDDFFSCTYSPNHIKIQRKNAGVLELLGEIRIDNGLPKDFIATLGTDSRGFFSCGINDDVYSSEFSIDQLELVGQFGVRIWDPVKNNAVVEMSKLEILSQKVLAKAIPFSETSNSEGSTALPEAFDGQMVNISPFEKRAPIKLPFFWSYSESLNSSDNWYSVWGALENLSTGVKIRATKETTGAMVLFPGSQEWDRENYKMSYDLNWANGTNLVSILRYQNSENFLAINIHNDYVRLEEYYKGKRKVLEEVVSSTGSEGNYKQYLNLVVRVNKNKISIFLDGKKKLESENPDRLPKNGLIGLKVWDKNRNEASVLVRSMNVDSI